MSVKISIVLPVFNAAAYLGRALDALEAQEYPSHLYEIIVVDNNSTDDSLAIAERHDSVKILHESKQGPYAARNRGIRASSGEIVAFIDPDCVATPRWLSTIVRVLSVPGRRVVLGRREFENPGRGLRKLSDYDGTLAEYIYSSETPGIYFGYANNMAIDRSLLDAQHGFREVLRGADTLFVQQVVGADGCAAVSFDADMRVVHCEVRGIADFYRKRLLYGSSNARLRKLETSRPLRQRERLRVFMKTVRECRYSLFEALELLALLSFGVLFYSLGRWRGYLC